jgi:sensor histidine kinase YesM
VAKGFPERKQARRARAFGPDSSPFAGISRRRARDSSSDDCSADPGEPEWAMATIPGLPMPKVGGERSAALAAFLRVFNPKTISIVFYFSAVMLLGRYLMGLYYEPVEEVLFGFVRSLRQNLITGLMLLVGIAAVEAFVAVRPLSRNAALLVGVVVSMTMTALSLPIRLEVAGGSLDRLSQEPSFFLSLFFLWASIGGIAYWMFRSLRENQRAQEELADAECCRETLQAQMVEARLSALQAQIEPHFLFNTLANVKRLYEVVPHRGREMLSSLISYLRAALPSMRQSGSTLGRELELARSFLTILQMRMGDRLDFSIKAEPALADAQVPPMVLPTLVENAIKHGLSPLPEGGRIDIAARRDGDDLLIDVRDNGAGFSSTGGSGVGLANTRSRLAALYGGRAGLSLTAAEPRGVLVSVRMPLAFKEAA